jgi:glycosyltransferase involved in cell wall biosynthesis
VNLLLGDPRVFAAVHVIIWSGAIVARTQLTPRVGDGACVVTSTQPPAIRTVILLAKKPKPDLAARIAAGDEPRVEYLALAQRLGAELLDYHAVDQSPSRVVRWLSRWLEPKWGLAWLGFTRRRGFDHIYATGEDAGIPLALLLRLARWYGRLTVVIHGAGTRRRRTVLRLLGSRIYRYVICLGDEQRRLLTHAIGLPDSKVIRLDYWCDQQFFQPRAATHGDYILSVGMESRDYATLQAAARQLRYPLRIVASGWSPGSGFTAVGGITETEQVTVVRGISFAELRDLYAGARFVVVPLKQVNYSAGVTSIVEGMAMGKAIIASAAPGILDYVRDGVSGKLVPVGDVAALRDAMAEFWEHPKRLEAMGRANREWIERSINIDCYVERIAELLGAHES